MSRRHISQREAHAAIKEVEQLQRQNELRKNAWSNEYPGGVNIDTITVNENEWYIARTARLLGHAIVAIPDQREHKFIIYGIKL